MFVAFIRRRRCAILGLGACAALLASRLAAAAEPVTWKFVPGDEHNYRTTQTMDMKMTMTGGNQVKTNLVQVIDMNWRVDDVDSDGTASITQRINRVKMTMEGAGGQNIAFDTRSKKPAEGYAALIAPLFNAMVSNSFHVRMTPRGEITSVDVPEEIFTAMKSAPGSQKLGEMATPEGFKKTVQGVSMVLPATLEVGKGSSTVMEATMPNIGLQKVKTSYIYDGPRDDDGMIVEVFKPTMVIAYEPETTPGAPTIEIKKQDSSGEVLFDRKAGRLESASIYHAMDVTVNAAGQQINQVIKQTVEMNRRDPDAAGQDDDLDEDEADE